jgi:hypothetical protein
MTSMTVAGAEVRTHPCLFKLAFEFHSLRQFFKNPRLLKSVINQFVPRGGKTHDLASGTHMFLIAPGAGGLACWDQAEYSSTEMGKTIIAPLGGVRHSAQIPQGHAYTNGQP